MMISFRIGWRCGQKKSEEGIATLRRNRSLAMPPIRLVQLALQGQPFDGLFSRIPFDLGARLQTLDPVRFFACPPKWALLAK
ncbi:MAG: hypothetical protein PHO89_11210 [Methylacidiphilaceae bacterium]|nr:hypothetical protein [Candidatus Methylacidiphilaceae bacterium]